MGRPRLGEVELTREVIIDAALEVLEVEGFAALSLARIASALGVQTPALYWHFANKADLYTCLVEVMFRDIIATLDPDLTGRELLWAFGRAKRANLRVRRDAAKLISIASVSDEIREVIVPALLARATEGDVTPMQARQMLTSIQALAVGWAIFEANPATNEIMRRSNSDVAFEKALTQLVFGEVPAKISRSVSRRQSVA